LLHTILPRLTGFLHRGNPLFRRTAIGLIFFGAGPNLTDNLSPKAIRFKLNIQLLFITEQKTKKNIKKKKKKPPELPTQTKTAHIKYHTRQSR
jgi:hypothetical protein